MTRTRRIDIPSQLGIQGSEQENAIFKSCGLEHAQDCQGDNYYVGPMGQIVWLYPDGTWWTDSRGYPSATLQEYLTIVKELSDELNRLLAYPPLPI